MRLFRVFAFYFVGMLFLRLIAPYIFCYVPIVSIATYMDSQISNPKELLFSSLIFAFFLGYEYVYFCALLVS